MQSSYIAIAEKLLEIIIYSTKSCNHFVHHGKCKIPTKVTNWQPTDLKKKKNIYIYTHTPILKNIAIWKKIYEMCINNRFIYFMYILKFQCVLKTDVYTQYIFFVDHVGITCNSRCIPGDFHLNKLVIDYNQYL